MKAKPVKIWAFFAVLILTCVCTAGAHTINIGGQTITLQDTCSSDHKLNVFDGTNTYCAEATTDTLSGTLHVMHNGTIYSICDGACGGGGEVPPVPPAPEVLSSSCSWTQSNANAYLLSDGRQYFDTTLGIDTNVQAEITLDVVNGKSAVVIGTSGSTCLYDFFLNDRGRHSFKIGKNSGTLSGNSSAANPSGKYVYSIELRSGSSYTKDVYMSRVNGTRTRIASISLSSSTACTDSNHTLLVLGGDVASGLNQTLNGGIKLYGIKLKNKSGTLQHDFQPVAAGTRFVGCGPNGTDYVAPTNGMWDAVTKKFYQAGGTGGQMGYGVDP